MSNYLRNTLLETAIKVLSGLEWVNEKETALIKEVVALLSSKIVVAPVATPEPTPAPTEAPAADPTVVS